MSELNDVTINNIHIPCVRSTKFLGVHIDFDLSWKSHINFVCGKIAQCVSMLKMCQSFLPYRILRNMYFAFAFPYIMYGVECWGSACKKYIDRIVIYQKKIIRLLFHLSPRTHCAPYARLAGIMFVSDVEFFMLCVLAFKAFNNMKLPVSISKLFCRPLHIYSTRASDNNFFVISSHLNIRLNSPVLKSVRIWNSLVYDIKLSRYLSGFKRNIKTLCYLKYD